LVFDQDDCFRADGSTDGKAWRFILDIATEVGLSVNVGRLCAENQHVLGIPRASIVRMIGSEADNSDLFALALYGLHMRGDLYSGILTPFLAMLMALEGWGKNPGIPNSDSICCLPNTNGDPKIRLMLDDFRSMKEEFISEKVLRKQAWTIKFSSQMLEDKTTQRISDFLEKHKGALSMLNVARLNLDQIKTPLDAKFSTLHNHIIESKDSQEWYNVVGSQVKIVGPFGKKVQELHPDIVLRDEYHVTCCHRTQHLVGTNAMLRAESVPVPPGTGVKVRLSNFVRAKKKGTVNGIIMFLVVDRMQLDDESSSVKDLGVSRADAELQCSRTETLHVTLQVSGEGGLANKDAGRATEEYKQIIALKRATAKLHNAESRVRDGQEESNQQLIKEVEQWSRTCSELQDAIGSHQFEFLEDIKTPSWWCDGVVEHFKH